MCAAIKRICCKHRVPRNVNVNKVNIFLRNRINSNGMLFLSMYTFIMRLCAQRNSCPKVNEVSSWHTYTHYQIKKSNHVTFLHLLYYNNNRYIQACIFLYYILGTMLTGHLYIYFYNNTYTTAVCEVCACVRACVRGTGGRVCGGCLYLIAHSHL